MSILVTSPDPATCAANTPNGSPLERRATGASPNPGGRVAFDRTGVEMTSHPLTLATLHAAAPGVLDVVFGPDGDFEGAPRWTCHVWGTVAGSDPEFFGVQSLHVDSEGPKVCVANIDRRFSPYMRDAALDLRIPSVAARLAGLCARALGLPGVSYSLSWSPHDRGGYVLSRPMEQRPGRPYMAAWGLDGLPIRCYSDADAPLPPPVPVRMDRRSLEEFLAALTLALAPRIAALQRTA